MRIYFVEQGDDVLAINSESRFQEILKGEGTVKLTLGLKQDEVLGEMQRLEKEVEEFRKAMKEGTTPYLCKQSCVKFVDSESAEKVYNTCTTLAHPFSASCLSLDQTTIKFDMTDTTLATHNRNLKEPQILNYFTQLCLLMKHAHARNVTLD